MTVTLLDPSLLRQDILKEFTVLVMSSGSYRDIDTVRVADIRSWIAAGNTLIASEQAAVWAISKKLAHVRLKDDRNVQRDSTTTIMFDQEDPMRGARRVPGAIVSARADVSHPLLFGISSPDVVLFKSTPYAFVVSNRRAITPVVYAQQPLVSGYLHRRSRDHIKGEAAVAIVPNGRGKVVLFADDEVFRAFWLGTSRMVTNAIFFARNIRIRATND